MRFRVVAIAVACGLLVCALGAQAQKPSRSAASATRSAQPRAPTSLEQAVQQVQQQTKGHILAADTIQRGQSKVYRIKVLTPQGQMRVMQLNSAAPAPARSGQHGSDHGGL